MLRRRLTSLFFVGAGATALCLAAVSPASAAAPGTPLIIRNADNELCLQPLGGSTDNGTPIVQEPCDGTNIQIWILQSVGGDLWHIVNDRTNTCLDARGGATNGTPVEEFTCDSISNENWSLNTNTPIVTTITSHVSGTSRDCLDNPEQSKMPDTRMQIFACNNTVAQQWFVG